MTDRRPASLAAFLFCSPALALISRFVFTREFWQRRGDAWLIYFYARNLVAQSSATRFATDVADYQTAPRTTGGSSAPVMQNVL